MALRKYPNADLRSKYQLFIQVGLVVALALAVLAFTVNIEPPEPEVVDVQTQDVVQMEEVLQTQQIEAPPPPPAPPVPIEVPDDEIIEEDFDLSSDLDLDAELDIPDAPPGPPPPPKQEEEEEPEEPTIFVVVEQMPELVGGLGALQGDIEYPEMARRAGVEGQVMLQFVVDENGNVQNPIVTRGIGAGCDEEALRVIKQAKFKPGMQRGKPVKVQFALPIRFRLR